MSRALNETKQREEINKEKKEKVEEYRR